MGKDRFSLLTKRTMNTAHLGGCAIKRKCVEIKAHIVSLIQ